jgi:hypothetical protein
MDPRLRGDDGIAGLVLFALANESTGNLFALANESTGNLFASANESIGNLFPQNLGEGHLVLTIKRETKNMSKTILLSTLIAISGASSAAPFTPDNLVVVRVGDGTATLANTGNAVFLDEYSITTAGVPTLVQSVPLPSAAAAGELQRQCVMSGTAASEGALVRSTNARFLTLACYGSNIPAATSLNSSLGTVVPRVIARVAVDSTTDTSTALSDFASGNNPRAAVSDGVGFWSVGGSGGVRYATLGQTTSTEISTTVTNMRVIDIVGGNLFVSHASGTVLGRLAQVGTALPTVTGQVMTSINGFPIGGTASPYGFAFVDLDATVAGVDTAYVADDAVDAIQKWALVAGVWTNVGSVNTIISPSASVLTNPRGLTARLLPGQGVAFATIADAALAADVSSIVIGIDTAGYNLAPVAPLLRVVNSGALRVFRGLAPTPEAAQDGIFLNGFEDTVPGMDRILW